LQHIVKNNDVNKYRYYFNVAVTTRLQQPQH